MSSKTLKRTAMTGAGLALAIGAIVPAASHASGSGGVTLAAAPSGHGSVELTWAAAYMSNSQAYSQSQAIGLAQNNDLVVGMPISFEKYAPAMRAANPDLTLLSYVDATFQTPGQVAGLPESDFAHNAAGGRIKGNAFGTYLMEPSSAAWRQSAIQQCEQRAAQGTYDGCLMDMFTMGIFSANYTSSMPINPATGQLYTQTDWRTALVNFAEQYSADAPNLVLAGNAVSNAARYWNNPVSSRPLALALPAAQTEDFLRGAAYPTERYPSTTDWLSNVAIITDLEAAGHTGLYSTKVWGPATRQEIAAWQSYSMATFLMGADGHSFFDFTDGRTVAGVTGADLPYSMPTTLGDPTGGMAAVGAVYERPFTNGMSVVNPGLTPQTVKLGGTYRDLEGDQVSSVTLGPHSGDVFLGGGSSSSPSPSPSSSPTQSPTQAPSQSPTAGPTSSPSDSPTDSPSDSPTVSPTDAPTGSPSDSPSVGPTDSSSPSPSPSPTTTQTADPPPPPPAAPLVQILSPHRHAKIRHRVHIRGRVSSQTLVTKAFIAIRDEKSHLWLRQNGTLGAYRLMRVTLYRGAKSAHWSVTLHLPKGRYGVAAIVDVESGVPAAARPWRNFRVR